MAMRASISENPRRAPSLVLLQTALAAKEFDRIVTEMGGRPTTPAESRLFREAIGHTDAKMHGYQRQLADFIHSQMQAHHWEKASGYDVVVSKGFTSLKPLVFTAPADEAAHNFRHPVADKTKIAQMGFGGFSRCLYPVQKFQSDTERVMSIILDREAAKWFKFGQEFSSWPDTCKIPGGVWQPLPERRVYQAECGLPGFFEQAISSVVVAATPK